MAKGRKPLWEVYPELTSMVLQDHKKKGMLIEGAHNFCHALMVAQYAQLIAEDETISTLAWIAGIIHNTDRLFPEKEVKKRLYYYLYEKLPYMQLIVDAVLTHSKPPDINDNSVTIALKDADKLVSIGPNIAVRSGQLYHNLPDFDPRYLKQPDPTSNYRNPKTVLRDIMFSLEWEGTAPNGIDWIRLPKAKELAKPWFKLLRAYIKGFAKQLKEVGLLPYPFPEHFAQLDKK